MKTTTIKSRILLLQCIDWLLLIGVFGGGIYFTMNSEYQMFAATAALIGLAVVNMFGRWAFTETARLKQELKKIERETPR